MTKSSTPKELYLVIALTLIRNTLVSLLHPLTSNIQRKFIPEDQKRKKNPQTNNIKINPQKSTGKEEREEMRERERLRLMETGEGKKRERREKLPPCKGDSRRMWNYSIDKILTCTQLNSIKRESI